MAIVNKDGMKISFECSDLILELKEDILEFGEDAPVCVWCKDEYGVTLYTNYDFIEEENPITSDELDVGEYFKEMTMGELLNALKRQNEIL